MAGGLENDTARATAREEVFMAQSQAVTGPMRRLRRQVLRTCRRVRHVKSPGLFIARLLGRALPDRLYMQLGHTMFFGFWPDFEHPATLSENIMASILRCRDPILKIAADKVRTRQYVAERVGQKYLVPLYGVWERAEEIPLQTLSRPCVLKPSAASGLVTFLRPAVDVDLEAVRATLRDWLRRDYSRYHREWAYQGIPQRILAEKMLIGDDGQPPPDYKLWVIGKKVRMITVDRDRFTQRTRNIYRADWEWVDVRQYPCGNHPPDPRPRQLDELIAVAEQLAEPFEFLRVDCYLNEDSLYVGEFTVSPGAGYERFEPASFSRELGSHWTAAAARSPTGG
jgi:hypothetical protein